MFESPADNVRICFIVQLVEHGQLSVPEYRGDNIQFCFVHQLIEYCKENDV